MPQPPIHPLRTWRAQHRMSQRALAAQAGVTQAFISLIERFHNVPHGRRLEALLAVTHLPTDALVRPLAYLARQHGAE